ncbi:MAG: BolA family transcriptional regulator [Rhodobacteraceae bacterium]|nr:MAG: BolA family transcriptional regulator [Paracoccaceae bacterium]|tara:strand:- start:852 stop:1112 length:261 start_codon:yes stop_codon:yes gene_type:complete
MKYFDRIENKLIKEFAPSDLEVIDESDLHAGHSGAKPGGETHFRVRMTSKSFVGMSRIDRQRAVHKALKNELEERVHALSLNLSAD